MCRMDWCRQGRDEEGAWRDGRRLHLSAGHQRPAERRESRVVQQRPERGGTDEQNLQGPGRACEPLQREQRGRIERLGLLRYQNDAIMRAPALFQKSGEVRLNIHVGIIHAGALVDLEQDAL